MALLEKKPLSVNWNPQASGPITSWELDGEIMETVVDFIYLFIYYLFIYLFASKSLQMVIAAMELKDTYSLEGKLWPT